MILAAHQPQYLAYTGYFDKIDSADVFILLDTVQYKKNEWINRNRIKTPNGPLFLTVPVSFNFGDAVKDAKISPEAWKKKHLQSLRTYYGKAPHFKEIFSYLEAFFQENFLFLGDLNCGLVKLLANLLGIKTRLEIASELPHLPDQPDARLIELSRYFDSDTYLAGAGGRDYMSRDIWQNSPVKVKFQDFHEPPRKQLYGEFLANLSIIGLLMNEGDESLNLLRQARRQPTDW